jgi:methionyl-tRNA formyltransferase
VPSLRLAFLGTPDFALPTLGALAEAGHEIAAVYCQPPRPAGRGHKMKPSPVQQLAESRGWPVRTPKSLRDPAEQAAFADLGLDGAVVVAYGLLLPKAVLEAPRLGCFNVHASLLPRWRGAAPIQRAILAGDDRTGISIMKMDEGLDTGPVYLSEAVPITARTTGADLHDGLANLGARLMVEVLERLMQDPSFQPVPQPEDGVTYAAKLEKGEGQLDWSEPAEVLERKVRALTPWPGAWFESGGERIKVLRALAVEGASAPGTLLEDPLTVACGEGALKLLEVQRGGRRAMNAADFRRGFALRSGEKLSCRATN